MEAGRACIANGLFRGNTVESADAAQAYVQAELKSTETWVVLPPDQIPKQHLHLHNKGVRLAFRLKRALYGHPDSGGYWERHCEEQLISCGFTKVPEWQSCYWHPQHKTYLVVYVDDFLISGPKAGVKKCWEMIRKPTRNHPGIDMDDPQTVSRCLGCDSVRMITEGQTSVKCDPKVFHTVHAFIRLTPNYNIWNLRLENPVIQE